jgi:peptidyl-dipeptidase A
MNCERFLISAAIVVLFLFVFTPAILADEAAIARGKKFVSAHEAKLRPLETAANQAWWNANISGKDEDFEKKQQAQNKVDEALSDPETFKELKAIKTGAKIDDLVTKRAIDVLYLMYLEKQVDRELLKKMVAKSNDVEKKFNTFRAKVEGKELTDNQVREELKKSRSSGFRQAVWTASKAVGGEVEKDLKELVKLRNQAAVKLGYKNYHELQLFLNEQNGEELLKLFDDLDKLTAEPFKAAKKEIDAKLAANCNVKPEDLMPWHYHDPFFQQTPAVFPADLDAPYKKADLIQKASEFYEGIELPIKDVIAHSDLHEKKGKNPHAFCTDIDRSGDVRVLANVVNNEQWMSTLLHEFGHSVYSSKNIPERLPYVLRTEAHILTTEGVAMMFERCSKRRAWLEKMGLQVGDPKKFDEAADKTTRYQLLIFSRWCQVMLRFEKGMYEKPDQDLNKLWWDLVEKYQLVNRPKNRNEPDYASKIHIVSAPVYYHNYMMGEMFASQVHHAIAKELYNDADPNTVVYVNNKKVGTFMRERVFEPGRTLDWNALTKYATGETLNAKAFAEDFKGR